MLAPVPVVEERLGTKILAALGRATRQGYDLEVKLPLTSMPSHMLLLPREGLLQVTWDAHTSLFS